MKSLLPILVALFLMLGTAFAVTVGVVMLTSGSCRPSPRPVSVVLIYEVDQRDENPDRPVDSFPCVVDKLVALIDRRINQDRPKIARVRPLDQRRIEVGVFPNHAEEIRRIERMVVRAGTLEMRILANQHDHKSLIERAGREDADVVKDATGRIEAWWVPARDADVLEDPELAGFTPEYWEIAKRIRKQGRSEVTEILVVKDPYDVTDAYLKNAAPEKNMFGLPCVGFVLNPAGAQRLGALTGENAPDPLQNFSRRLGIIVDGQLFSAPAVQAPVFSRGQITGSFTRQEAQELADVLNAGSLPVPIKQVEKRPVSTRQ